MVFLHHYQGSHHPGVSFSPAYASSFDPYRCLGCGDDPLPQKTAININRVDGALVFAKKSVDISSCGQANVLLLL